MNAKGSLLTADIQRSLNTLRNKVPMPALSADQGNAGDYAISTEGELAIYSEALGEWRFYNGYRKE